jgi:hypothetical protein
MSEDKEKFMFEKGNQKEAAVTNERMLANELRTPKGSYFDNLKTIVAALTLSGFILPMVPVDKTIAAGSPQETKQTTEGNPQTETGQKKIAEFLQRIKDEKGLEISFQAAESDPSATFFCSEIIQSKEDIPNVYSRACQKAQETKSYQEVAFQMVDGQPLSLKDFIEALKIEIHPAVYYNLDQTKYRAVFSYRDETGTVDRGLVFRVKRGVGLGDLTQSFNQVTAGLASWGATTVFTDLKNIFYPESDISSGVAPKFQETIYHTKRGVWTDKIRYANIKDQNGKDLFVAYNYSTEEVRLADSVACLKRMLDVRAPQPEK